MKKFSQILTLILTLGFIAVFAVWGLIAPDADESRSERRLLAKFPKLSFSSVTDGSFMSGFEKYMLDQFPQRDGFRSLKAVTATKLFAQKDNNGLYSVGEHLSKLDFPTKEKSADYAARRFKFVYEKYLKTAGIKTYMCVVPDKNTFLAAQNGYPDKDVNAIIERLKKGFPEAEQIDISGLLSADDFYFTDIHWRQEKITDIADEIVKKMNAKPIGKCETHNTGVDFYGVCYGQSALPHSAESLYFLDNDVIRGLKVFDVESSSEIPVYDIKAASGRDPYEMFLGGSRSIIKITNPSAENERKLFVFRDSFGSSIAPLLTAGYSEITLIDIRYVSPALLSRFVDFSGNADALFLYSASVINNSETIR